MCLFSLNVLIPVSCSVFITGVITSSSSITPVVSCFILYPHPCAFYPAFVHSPPPLIPLVCFTRVLLMFPCVLKSMFWPLTVPHPSVVLSILPDSLCGAHVCVSILELGNLPVFGFICLSQTILTVWVTCWTNHHI